MIRNMLISFSATMGVLLVVMLVSLASDKYFGIKDTYGLATTAINGALLANLFLRWLEK